MKAALVHGKHDIRIEEVPTPRAGPGEMVVKVRASGICATDVKTLLGQGPCPRNSRRSSATRLLGRCTSWGSGVTGFALGERVAVYPIAVCGECYYCKRGRHNLCSKEFGLGHGIDGGFAEYVRLPREIVNIGGVVKLPDGLPFEEAALAEPLSCGLAALRAHRLNAGRHRRDRRRRDPWGSST